MKHETLVWTVVCLLGLVGLIATALIRDASTDEKPLDGMGYAFVQRTPETFVEVPVIDPALAAPGPVTPEPEDGYVWINPESPAALDYDPDVLANPRDVVTWTDVRSAPPREYYLAEAEDPSQSTIVFSWSQTIGLWVAAFFTLAIFSFLYKDNPLYKVAEAVVVGVSAAYWMVVGFWDMIVPNLFGALAPSLMNGWALPALAAPEEPLWQTTAWWLAWVPLILGIMLLWRLSPKGGWISRWPLAFLIGTTAGFRLVAFIHSDFLAQIRNSIVPLVVYDPLVGFEFWDSVANVVLVVGIFTCLVYFFFSIEHKGVVGKTARVGIWFLMITFGAAFGYTVMGRIALLAIRIEFLFDDWLWLIDPRGVREIQDLTAWLVHPLVSTPGLLG